MAADGQGSSPAVESTPNAGVRCHHPGTSAMKIACLISFIVSFLVIVHVIYFYFEGDDSKT